MSDDRLKDTEMLFYESIKNAVEQAKAFEGIDLVIGFPFDRKHKNLSAALGVLEEGLTGLQELRHALVICTSDSLAAGMLEDVKCLNLKSPHLEFLVRPGNNGRSDSIRSMMEIANVLEADLVICAAELEDEGSVPQPDWIRRLIEPIRKDYDLVVTSFHGDHMEDLIGSLFTTPLLEVFYGYHLKGFLSGIYALSHDTVEDLCIEIKFWTGSIREYGIDPWMVSRAILWDKKICEVELDVRLKVIPVEKLSDIFMASARSLFECIKRDEDHWLGNKFIIKTPDICNYRTLDVPSQPAYALLEPAYLKNYYHHLYNSIYDDYLCAGIGDLELAPLKDYKKDYHITGKTWTGMVYRLLFEYRFVASVCKEDVLNALTYAFIGRVANAIEYIQTLAGDLEEISTFKTQSEQKESIISSEVDAAKAEQRKDFLRLREQFMKLWERKKLEMKPPLIPFDYLEFIPGTPILLPKKIEGQLDQVVLSEELFTRLQSRYQEAFNRFIHDGLGAPVNADSKTIIGFMKEFVSELEKTMDSLLPGDLYTEEGTRQVIDGLFQMFYSPKTFSVRNEVLREMLLRFPPLNVMIPAGYKTPRELINKMDIRDAVSLANLLETRKYGDTSLMWMLDNLRPDGMGEVEIRPIVLGDKVLGGTAKQGNISDLNKLTSRIVVRHLSEDTKGEFLKLRFVLFVARHIMIAENYDILWRTYAKERKNLGIKVRNSLIGRYETNAFSAHNIFENLHHRTLVSQFRALSQRLLDDGHIDQARMIKMMCDAYGLSQVLADGTFLPCSVWSWASYSYKGGKGTPTPLFSHVELKWFNHDLLEAIYQELGYDPDEIMKMVIQLIGEGRASENLLDVLLGIKPKDVTVVVQETQDYPLAEPLVRYAGNPVLSPIKEHAWESKYVLNTAALRIKDKVYLLYRAYGDDEVSRIGLAVTDGYNVLERLPEPVFVPQDREEKKGVEDPRTIIIGNKIYMLYTAYDGVIAQISAAAISLEDFLNKRFDQWERKGMAFQDIWDKDAIMFPDRIKGKYVIYHRIEPSIWVSHLDKLEFPAPKDKHAIILGPRSGQMWDSLKIGAGSQPIKTIYGWLLIYHGVDRNRVYRLGVILADLENPERLLYRSPNPVLSPETEYEIGHKGESWVPNVVFTCGAVPASDKEVLDATDEVLVYYGAADTHVCLATGRIGDLIPESVRREVSISCSATSLV
ncbi:MAG: glycosidase [Desulfotomaculaceae bacterium]|nr:glycosidase [Desulfotomaculaceae bacterium]